MATEFGIQNLHSNFDISISRYDTNWDRGLNICKLQFVDASYNIHCSSSPTRLQFIYVLQLQLQMQAHEKVSAVWASINSTSTRYSLILLWNRLELQNIDCHKEKYIQISFVNIATQEKNPLLRNGIADNSGFSCNC